MKAILAFIAALVFVSQAHATEIGAAPRLSTKLTPPRLPLSLPMKPLPAKTLTPISANTRAAGGRDGGGGVVFVCNEEGQNRIYLADLYGLLKSGNSTLLREQEQTTSEVDVMDAITDSIGKADPEMAQELKNNLGLLTFTPVPSNPLLGDDDITNIPAGCEKEQLAIQYFARDVVEYNESYYASMSPLQRALFKLHEAYVRIYRSNCSTVRGKVASEAGSTSFEDLLRPSTVVKSDAFSATLAKELAGRVIRCEPATSPAKGYEIFFPLTIRATDEGQGKTVISIESRGGGSFSGSGEYLSVRYSDDQMIFKDGDDDWNELFLGLDAIPRDAQISASFRFVLDDGEIEAPQVLSCLLETE